jgi:hypothetical protein
MKKSFLMICLAISVILWVAVIMIFVPAQRTTGIIKEGYLEGKVSIGPICPVERPDMPCPVPPETYAARMILVYAKDGKTLVGESSIKVDGTYQIGLPVGEYVVNLKKNGIDRSAEVPANVFIKEGETTTLDISIDTGIR